MNSFLLSQNVQTVATKLLLPSIFVPSSLNNPVCLQCVRWRRKPRWLPVAKTKMYRVPPRIKYPEEERVELLRLFNNYRTSMKAIRYYLSEKIKSQTTAPEVIAEQLRLQQKEHDHCIALNNEWNKEVAIARQQRVAEEFEKTKLKILETIEQMKIDEEKELCDLEHIVRVEKEKSKSFITPENIDEAIETALSSTVDYNYCIDLRGNIYRGLRARPGVTDPENTGTNDETSVKQALSQ